MPRNDYYLPGRKLVSQDDAAITQRADVPRSKFTGSWNRLAAYNAGRVYPIMVDEILPGDHMSYDLTAYIRMATPLFPIFSNQRVDTHFFFVPYRLVWDNWQKFMGEQDNPGDSINFQVPRVHIPQASLVDGDVADHMGLPQANQMTAELRVNALPFRAYNLIWNQWFRDQNVTGSTSFDVPKGNGPDAYTAYGLGDRMKFHDYFTSALPWPQKFIAPTIPLGGMAPVTGLAFPASPSANFFYNTAVGVGGGAAPDGLYKRSWNTDSLLVEEALGGPKVYADLAATTGVAINTFRQAFLVQQLLERDARGGTRYTELIRSHFGVTSPDFRLQRPEYIGGGSTKLNITPVAQTAPTAGAPVGALGAAGTAVGNHRASYASTEHGVIIGVLSIRTELAYQQGIPRMWNRRTRYDFYWPSLAGLGEQAIPRKEIYATGHLVDDEIIFGYQERWHEYRQKYSEVVGVFRSTATGTIDQWHLAQRFVSPPALNYNFVKDSPPVARVLAAGALANGQQYLADLYFQRTAVRPVPTFGTPVTLGRF